jgi:glycosyltransferase involved in cell wall biosynthesis
VEMNNPGIEVLDLAPSLALTWQAEADPFVLAEDRTLDNGLPNRPPDADALRAAAWEIGERRPADWWTPPFSHVGLAMVSPYQGFAHWRILPGWVDEIARQRGDSWHHCRLVLRLYDVSFIAFNGFNAHSMMDQPLAGLSGSLYFKLPRPGTCQLGEVGFLLRTNEFVPAARSHIVQFPPDAPSARGSHTALMVNERGQVEEIGNLWDQGRILHERRQPKLRRPLRIASFAFAARASGQEGPLADLVTELAAGQGTQGHEAHVFVPASPYLTNDCLVDGVHYHALAMSPSEDPLESARAFSEAAQARLDELPPFDFHHLHEWMTGLGDWVGQRPTILSVGSIEATRRNGGPVCPMSKRIEGAERAVAQRVSCLLTPDWLRSRAIAELDVAPALVHAFALEGRMPNEWECHLDLGQVKSESGVGPLDRLVLFVGPLEHAAGVDLLVEAMPVLLQRAGNLRLAFAGAGDMFGHLEHRAGQLGVAHAVRVLGHVDSGRATRLVRAAEALVLPSRYRVPFDDAVVDLARRAGRPVVTTHGGPAHLVRHGETGLITYDNPGSMVWALDQILHDPARAEQMGNNGRRSDGSILSWSEVGRHYLKLCAACLPELTEV